MPRPAPSAADRRATLLVTVTDLSAVQRVVGVLTGRASPVTRLVAEQTADGRWEVGLECATSQAQTDLLRRRLCRLPSVIAVVVGSPG